MKINIKPTTVIRIYEKKSSYVAGQGSSVEWLPFDWIEFCEWRGSYGDRQTAAQAIGVNDSATVRMYYSPTLYEKLRTVQAVIVKNNVADALKNGIPDKDNPDVYELWGGVDNIGEQNQYMEFRVKRYEGK